jgi:CheY-like chemotaxis protein
MKTSQVQHTLMAYLRHELCTPLAKPFCVGDSLPLGTGKRYALAEPCPWHYGTKIDATIGYSAMLLEELQTQPDSIYAADLRKIQGCSQELLTLVTTILDGLELLQQLKQDDRFKHIPAIAISALETIDVAVKCIDLASSQVFAVRYPNHLLTQAVALLGNLTILQESGSANENGTAKSSRIYTYRSKIDA